MILNTFFKKHNIVLNTEEKSNVDTKNFNDNILINDDSETKLF